MKRMLVSAAVAVVTATAASAAFEPGLYAVQSSDSEGNNGLFRIDPATGAATKLTSLSHNSSLVGATFLHGELYASDILAFNPTAFYGTLDENGQFSGIHDQGFDLNWHGLASSESLGVTWSISQQNNRMLVQTDLNGTITEIGPTGIDGRGMAYDDTNGILYAVNFEDASLYTVDVGTGQSTRVGPLGIPSDLIGLAYDESTQTLYLSEADVTDSLYTVDVTTGAATLIGASGFGYLDGLAWIPEPASLALLAIGALVAVRRR